MVSSVAGFRPDMVSSSPDEVKEAGNPKVVGSVADKVADDVDTVDDVVKKVKEPIVESKAVESMPEKVVDEGETVDEVVEKVEKSVVESKLVEAVPDKVADKVDTVKVVNKKPKEEGPWNRLVQSDSLREPDENDERTPETVPKKESLEPAPALATKSLYVPPHLRMFQSLRSR